MKNIFIIFLSLTFFSACSSKSSTNDSGKLQFITTTGMIGDAIQHIAGDKAEVSALMGPGVDPHLYKATQGDLGLLTGADVIFYNGLHLEGKMAEVFEKLSNTKNVIAVSDGVNGNKIKASTTYENAPDPHIWFDLSLWSQAVGYASNELIRLYPEHKEYFAENTKTYLNDVHSMHIWAKNQISIIPEKQRVLVTAHDAFGYFSTAYNIEVRGLQGISTLSEFGLKDITDLTNFIISRNIKAVFVESSVSERAIKAVVEGCQSKGHNVVIGGTLYSDAMGEAGTEAGNYIGMVKTNVNTIVNALK